MITSPHGEYENDGRAVVKERLTSGVVTDDLEQLETMDKPKVPREQGGCSPIRFVNGPVTTTFYPAGTKVEVVRPDETPIKSPATDRLSDDPKVVCEVWMPWGFTLKLPDKPPAP